MVWRPPVGSGARAGCGRGRSAPGCSNRRPRARRRDVFRLMSSRGPASNLRPISRYAATAFSLGPCEPARELVRPPDPAAVSPTRQSQGTPNIWRHSPHPSLRPVLSDSSTSATSRLQPACHDCVPRQSLSRTSHVTLGGLYRRITCCPPTCPSHEPGSDSEFGSSAFPRRTGRQYPFCQYPWLTGRQCPIAQRSVSRHPSQFIYTEGSRAVSAPSG